MLILAKTILGIMLGFITSLIAGFIIIPILRKKKIGQQTCKLINERHIKKAGTPTIGGLIFIIPTILTIILLYLKGSIRTNHNLIILMFVFMSYGLLGYIDDKLKIKYHNNEGLSIKIKFSTPALTNPSSTKEPTPPIPNIAIFACLIFSIFSVPNNNSVLLN